MTQEVIDYINSRLDKQRPYETDGIRLQLGWNKRQLPVDELNDIGRDVAIKGITTMMKAYVISPRVKMIINQVKTKYWI
jgi:hypothetical protein